MELGIRSEVEETAVSSAAEEEEVATAAAAAERDREQRERERLKQHQKEALKQTIKDWVACDNDICAIERDLKRKKSDKKKISLLLMGVMSQNDIDCFDIQNGSQILYNKKEVKKPLTKAKIKEILAKYYRGDSGQADDLENFIFQHREVVWRENILRKNNADKPKK